VRFLLFGTNLFCLGLSRLKLLTSKEIYSFCPNSDPPSKEIVMPIADLYPLIVEGTNCLISKNQIPDRSAEPVIIPALPEDPSSRLFCPIRILSIYLDRTKNSRSAKNSRLFLPLKKGDSDIKRRKIILTSPKPSRQNL
jgi:hypothetical protein